MTQSIGITDEDGEGVGGRQQCSSTAIFLENGLFSMDKIIPATFCRLSGDMHEVRRTMTGGPAMKSTGESSARLDAVFGGAGIYFSFSSTAISSGNSWSK